MARDGYRVGVPEPGYYAELLNSDAAVYAGGNVGNQGGRHTEPVPAHGHPAVAHADRAAARGGDTETNN